MDEFKTIAAQQSRTEIGRPAGGPVRSGKVIQPDEPDRRWTPQIDAVFNGNDDNAVGALRARSGRLAATCRSAIRSTSSLLASTARARR